MTKEHLKSEQHAKAKAMGREIAKAKADFAYSAVRHVDNHGRVVEERTISFGERPADFTRFVSFGKIRAQLKIGAPVSKTFDIRLPHATTAEEAFAQIHEYYEEAYDKAVVELNEEIEAEMKAQHERLKEQANQVQTITGAAIDSKGRLQGGIPPIIKG
jgi:hypothetical protein